MGERVGCAMVTPVTVLMAVSDPPLDELETAMNSILTQTFPDFEFLIVDDGSANPAVPGYLARRAARDSRIRVARERHRGLTASLNRGLELARGDYIARQDADDWSEPGRLARQIEFFRGNPEAVLCGTDAWMHQQNGRRLWRTRLPNAPSEILSRFERGNPFVHGATMYSRRAAIEAGGYAEELRCSQDYDFFWRLAERGTAVNLGEPLYHYRFSAGSVSAGKAVTQAVAHRAAKILARARKANQAAGVSAALAEAWAAIQLEGGLHRALLKQADHLMLAGAYRRAGRAYVELLWRRPASALAWGKLMRLGVFVTLPGMREECFR